jgi:hypothetical protein
MNSASTNPLLLPENLTLYGLDIWKAVNDTNSSENEQEQDNGLYQLVRKCSETVKICNSSADSLEKVIKNSHRSIDIFTILTGIADGTLIRISASFKSSIEFLESIRFVNACKTLLVPQENKKYFLFDPANSIQKKWDRTLLAAHTGCKTLRNLNKWKLIDLGKIAKAKIAGHLTTFHLFTDGLMIGSSFFGLWDSAIKFNQTIKNEHRLIEKNSKWNNRPRSIALLLIGDQEEIILYQKRYESKIEKLEAEIELKQRTCQSVSCHDQDVPSMKQQAAHEKLQIELVPMQNKLSKIKARFEKIKASDFHSLATELSAKDWKGKLTPLSNSLKKSDRLFHLQQLKIASTASKILVIVAALWLTAINLWTTLPLVLLLSLGFIADSLGIVKILVEKAPITNPSLKNGAFVV